MEEKERERQKEERKRRAEEEDQAMGGVRGVLKMKRRGRERRLEEWHRYWHAPTPPPPLSRG